MKHKGAMRVLRECSTKDQWVLAEIVHMLQKRGVCGTKGSWQVFLKSLESASSFSHDPLSRRWKDLSSFLETITDEKAVLMVMRFYSWIRYNREMDDSLRTTSLFPETPEEELVRMTLAHIRFQQDYKFDSYDEGWILSDSGMTVSQRRSPVKLLSLDCEMVDCECGTQDVVRVCLVDQNLTTVVDTLVRPSNSVVDYKSHITGVSAEDLEAVTVTQADVQKQVKEFLVRGTILVGHSLHNDLKALKIDHRMVIDTQYIFPVQGQSPLFRVGLRALCKAVLGYDFRENDQPHDCLDDAKIPMRLVLHRLQHGTSPLSLPREVDESVLSKLLLHKIPVAVTAKDLKSLFPKFSTCQIQDLDKVGKSSKYTSKYAVFKNKTDAKNAFTGLKGFIGADISGRQQKTVFFRPKASERNAQKVHLIVRKMAYENHGAAQATTIQLNFKPIETATKLSQISESAPAEIRNTQVVKGLSGKGNAEKRKMSSQDHVEPPNLPDMGEAGNGNENALAQTVEKASKHKRHKKQKKSPLEDVADEPSRLSECFPDKHSNDCCVTETDGSAIGQNLKGIKLKRSRHKDLEDIFPSVAKMSKATTNGESATEKQVKSSMAKKKKERKKKKKLKVRK